MAHGSSSSAAARAAGERRIEEEEMTNYPREDSSSDSEYKIVRSITGAFRNPAELEKLRQEEAQAGWVMVEKFDEARVRFKRPTSARENDSRLPPGVDPYRSYYGVNYRSFVLWIAVIAIIVVGVITLCAIGLPFLALSKILH